MRTLFALFVLLLAPQLLQAEPATLQTPTGTLYGTLELPRCGSKAVPVALLLSGSGATDRNGNTLALGGANNSLQYLAEGLAARGIASLRTDKRGVGQSAKTSTSESELRFKNYIDDAVLWARQLRRDKRFSTLTIIGHSEGSLVGMMAARQVGADAFVSIAGFGRPAGQALLEQLKPQLTPELFKQAQEIVLSLTEGKTVASIPPVLSSLFRPSVQPYVISWFQLDAAQEIKKLSVPVLIVQGTTDIQVKVEDAKLLQATQPKAKLLVIDGMNHVLKAVSGDRAAQIHSYADATLPVVPELVEATSQFIRGIKKSRR